MKSWLRDAVAWIENSTITCDSCGRMAETPQEMWVVQLPVDGQNDLMGCLKQYHKVEEMKSDANNPKRGNAVMCRYCEEYRDGTKMLSMQYLPKVLTLQLKRFDNEGQKNCQRVTYPANLDVEEFVENCGMYCPEYELCTMIVHEGGTFG